MAWSEAARRASALVRRRMAEMKGNFHLGPRGTPSHETTLTGPLWRKTMAQNLRAIRKRAQTYGTFDWVRDDPKIGQAAYASMQARYYGKTKPKVTSPYEPKKLERERKARGRKSAARRLANYRRNYMP